jgi:hypothetical protein
MKNVFLLTAALLLAAAAPGCGDSEPAGPDTTTPCQKLVQYCPTGYSWSYYVTGEQDCRDTFDCVYDFYSGNCRDQLVSGFDCLGNVTDASGCSACDSILTQLSTTCTFPASCLQ